MSTKQYDQILGRSILPPKKSEMTIRTQSNNKGIITAKKNVVWIEVVNGKKNILIDEKEDGTIKISLINHDDSFIKSFTLDELFTFIKSKL
jgi:hypothetical protein